MHTTIPILKATFSPEINAREVTEFRGAFLEKLPRGQEAYSWFHNHDPDGSSRYLYPRVQYKRERRMPVMICFGEALDTGQKLLTEERFQQIKLRNHQEHLKLEGYDIAYYPIGMTEEMDHVYMITNWQALNQHNYKTYQELDGIQDMIDFLEPKLIGNILSFAKATHWHIKEKIKVRIIQMYPTKYPKYKGVKVVAFNFVFKANILLPNQIGLGKGVSRGFGNLRKLNT